jgi:hypothetical protein
MDMKNNNISELSQGPCRDIYFIMARGSGEWGTLVRALSFQTAGVR